MVGHVGNADLDTWKVTKLHEDGWWYPQSNYFESTFRTGPVCTQGGVAVPQLLTLQDGAVIDTLEPWLSWSVDGCMPRFFLFQISTTPDFINPVWERNPDDPGDYTKLRGAWALGGQVDYMLRDCQEYYWRVQGAIGGDPYLPNEPVEYGAFSEVRSFEVNLGGCDSIQHYVPTPIPQPVIRSIVPTAVPVPPQTPCASFTDPKSCDDSGYCHWVPRFASPSSCETGP